MLSNGSYPRSLQIGADRAVEVYAQIVRACSSNSEIAALIARFTPD